MRKLFTILLLLLPGTLAFAHVGSADVFYEGDAGPYHLFVTVRLPQVVPGIAEIEVRSALPDVESIRVVPLRLSGPGSNLPSVPDLAQRSKKDPQFFVSSLWFMEFGALQVRMEVNGDKGKAEISIPVASFARKSLPMARWLSGLLAVVFLFLTLGAVLIPGAIVTEGTVAPGAVPPSSNRRRARIVMAIALTLALLTLYQNRAAWNVQAAMYDRYVDLLKPPQAEVKLIDGNRLVIRPAGPIMVPVVGQDGVANEVNMDQLLPDHGHVMHLVLVSMPGMGTMFHLHPIRAGGVFSERLPAMPAGDYRVFGDIVDRNGYPWTLIGKVQLPTIKGTALVGDDSDWQGAQLTDPISETTVSYLPDGARMVWERGNAPLKANAPADLRFRVEEKDGTPAHDLEPYMGMVAHAEIICTDLSVFAHIHPAGSMSMAALDLAQAGLMVRHAPGDRGMAMEMAQSSRPQSPEFKFPYGFPHPGDYRIFVQIKRLGRPEGAAFDAHVQ